MSIGTDAIEREIESEIQHIPPTICDLTTPDLFLLHLSDAKGYLYGMTISGAITKDQRQKILGDITAAEFDLNRALKINHRVSTAAADGTLLQLEDRLDWEENANQ